MSQLETVAEVKTISFNFDYDKVNENPPVPCCKHFSNKLEPVD